MSARGFQSLLQSFLVDYLPRRRGYSPNTVASYRDAFVLLLCWFADERGIPAERLAKLSDAGMDARTALPLLASYMGHADIKSTEYYLHFTREAMLRIVDAQAEDSETVFGGVI